MGRHSVPEDPEFPQLELLFDRERLRACLQATFDAGPGSVTVRRCKVRRLYYRPDRSCRLLLECRLGGPGGSETEQLYFGKLWRNAIPTEVSLVGTNGMTPPPLGPARLVVPALRLVLQAYPNDPDLPGLASLADPTRLLHWLREDPARCGLPSEAELLALRGEAIKVVPGQRAGFRFEIDYRDPRGRQATHRVYAKAYRRERAQTAVGTLLQIENSQACRSGVLRLPRIYAFDEARGIVWQEFVSGTKLSKDESAEGLRRNAANAGRALAAFHASSLQLGRGKDHLSQVKDLRKAQSALARSYPEYGRECARLTESLLDGVASLPPVPLAPVHGSFKSSHLFEVDGSLVLIDFDGAGLGDPIYDVGRFLARVVAGGAHTEASQETIRDTIQSFQQSYRQGVPWDWPEGRVRWSTCAHLIGSQIYKSVKRANVERIAATLRVAAAWSPDLSTSGQVP